MSHCEHNKRLSEHTLAAYQRDLDCFLAFKQSLTIVDCDKEHLKRYVVWLNQQDLSVKTVKRRLACLKSMFRWLELEEVIENNPFHKLDFNLKLPRQLPRNIPKKELKKILKAARMLANVPVDEPYSHEAIAKTVTSSRAFNRLTTLVCIELLFATGMRVSELVGLTLSHVFITERKMKILGKGQRERYVFLPDQDLKTLIHSYIRLRFIVEPDHDHLISNSRGKAPNTQYVRKLLHKLTENLVSDKVTPHMYRHSAACQLLESGVDIRYVQRLLGHQSISTTELYTHVNDVVLQRKIAKANTRKGLL